MGTTAADDPYEVLSLVAITWDPNSEAMVEGPRFLRPPREALGVAGVGATRGPPVMLAAALLARVDGRYVDIVSTEEKKNGVGVEEVESWWWCRRSRGVVAGSKKLRVGGGVEEGESW